MNRWIVLFCLLGAVACAPMAHAYSISGTVTGGNPIGFPPHLKYAIAIPLGLDTTNFLSNLALVSPLNNTYSFSSLDSGMYILFSFQDMNINFLPDLDEPRGFWGTDTVLGIPSIMNLIQDTTGINIVLNPPNSGGFTGTLAYGGTQRGRVYVFAYYEPSFQTLGGIGTTLDTATTGNGSYTALTDTFRTYYAYAFMDVNGNFAHDEDEPYGVFGGVTPAAINVQQSNFPSNVNITLQDPAASSSEFSGVVSYTGAARGPTYVYAFRDSLFATPHGFGSVLDTAHTGNGPYTTPTDTFGTFYAYAFMDLNSNLQHDPGEPYGVYGGSTRAPFSILPDNPPGSIDIILQDPADTPEARPVIPVSTSLTSVYPNPFNITSTVIFTVGKDSRLELALYDILGRQVAVLVHGDVVPGEHRIILDGSGLSTGVYYLKLTGSHMSQTQKVILLK
jgi:hypothetical protein